MRRSPGGLDHDLSIIKPFPLLLLPELFTEKASSVRKQAQRQTVVLRRSLSLLTKVA